MFYSTNVPSTIACHILILLIGEGGALRCWQCSTETDRFCGDPIDISNAANGTATDCDEAWGLAHHLHSHAVCKKVTHRETNKLVTVRSCGWDSSETYGWGPCSTGALAGYPVEFCGICWRDACNTAGHQLALARATRLALYAGVVISGLRLQTRFHL